MSAVKVSVVIPARNAAAFIRRTLDSALGQTFARSFAGAYEVIVVDDGSSDATAAIASSYGPPVALMAGAGRGVSAARNLGVARARGEHVAFLDHDDLWEPDKIARQCAMLDDEPRAALVFTQATVERDGAVTEIFPRIDDPGVFLSKAYENLVHWNYIPMSAVMARRSALGAEPFDVRFRLAEDWDLWLRLADRAGTGGVRFLAEPLTRYMIVAGRATERMADLRLEDIEIFEEQLRRHPWLGTSDPRRCRETRHRLHREAGYWLLKEGRRGEARRALGAAWRMKPSDFRPLGRLIASLLGLAASHGAAR